MRGLVGVALAVLDELGVDEVDVLGVSYGGAVAQEFAHRAPARTRRLVLAATSTGMLSVPAGPRVLVHLATPLRYWRRDYARRIVGDIYGGRSRTDPWAHRELSARFDRPPTVAGYLGQLVAAMGWTSITWLPRLSVPTLVMTGDDDPIIPTVNGRILARLIPGARLYVVRGGGPPSAGGGRRLGRRHRRSSSADQWGRRRGGLADRARALTSMLIKSTHGCAASRSIRPWTKRFVDSRSSAAP